MWRGYSKTHFKNNRTIGFSIVVSTFIAVLFLSLICTLYYNLWIYEIERVESVEGTWQGRIQAVLSEDTITYVSNFRNVETIQVNKALSDADSTVLDLTFKNPRTIYTDLPMILEDLDLQKEAGSYHESLLSQYLIFSPHESGPPLLLIFYLITLSITVISLVLIIHYSFAVTMNTRIHHFGILSSIGATPSQIRNFLILEAFLLCSLPGAAALVSGVAFSYGIIHIVNLLAINVPGRYTATFHYHISVLLVTVLASFITILFSVLIPARTLSKVSPLEALRSTDELRLKKRQNPRFLKLLFGPEGELAGISLKAQKRALRTSTLSLTLSVSVFVIMLCFLTLSEISTNHTYFERYKDSWDIMVTVSDIDIGRFPLTTQIREIDGVQSCVLYQKADADILINVDNFSNELINLGGLEAVSNIDSTNQNEYLVKAPLIIMDDESYADYCQSLKIQSTLYGSIVLNRIWDSVNSNFRYKKYIPFLNEKLKELTLHSGDNKVPLLISAFTQEPPVLREEYSNYSLVQFISQTQWFIISESIENQDSDSYIRILADSRDNLSQLEKLEDTVSNCIGSSYTFVTENRIQKKITNDTMIRGYRMIIGGICILLAIIGISNVFSNTLGFLRQRKREFSQYISIGMTPNQMRKMFRVEALVIAGRPLLITIPITVVLTSIMIHSSYLDPVEFLEKIPLVPIILFYVVICILVGVAYRISGNKVINSSVIDNMKEDYL